MLRFKGSTSEDSHTVFPNDVPRTKEKSHSLDNNEELKKFAELQFSSTFKAAIKRPLEKLHVLTAYYTAHLETAGQAKDIKKTKDLRKPTKYLIFNQHNKALSAKVRWAILCHQPVNVIQELLKDLNPESAKKILESLSFSDTFGYKEDNHIHIYYKNLLLLAVGLNQLETVTFLMDTYGIDANVLSHTYGYPEIKGPTLLQAAVQQADLPMVQALVERGANINSNGKSLLVLAAQLDKWEIMGYLLSKNINTHGDHGKQALTYVIKKNTADSLQMVRLLLDNGVDSFTHIEYQNTKKHLIKTTLLHYATRHKNKNVISFLITREGMDINRKEPMHGNTALHQAIGRQDSEMITFLLENEADIHSTNNKGETPLLFAVKKGGIGIVNKLLEYHPANRSAASAALAKSLQFAASEGKLAIMLKIAEKNPTQLLSKENQKSPLHTAKSHVRAQDPILAQLKLYKCQSKWQQRMNDNNTSANYQKAVKFLGVKIASYGYKGNSQSSGDKLANCRKRLTLFGLTLFTSKHTAKDKLEAVTQQIATLKK